MNKVKKINFRTQRNFSDNISKTFDFVRMNHKMILKIFVRIPGPILLLASLVLMFSFYNIFGTTLQAPFSPSKDLSASGIGFLAFGGVLYIIASLLFTVAINEYIVLYQQSEEPEQITVKDVFQNAKNNFWLYLGGGLLIGIMILVGFVLLFIPGIYLAIATLYFFIIISAEKKNIGQSISRSFNLIKGYWWSSFGYILVVGLLVMAISYIIQLPIIGINTYILLKQSSTNMGAIIYGVSNGISYLIYVAISSLSYIAIAMYYYSIVEAKEQVGLQQEIAKMDVTNEETAN